MSQCDTHLREDYEGEGSLYHMEPGDTPNFF